MQIHTTTTRHASNYIAMCIQKSIPTEHQLLCSNKADQILVLIVLVQAIS